MNTAVIFAFLVVSNFETFVATFNVATVMATMEAFVMARVAHIFIILIIVIPRTVMIMVIGMTHLFTILTIVMTIIMTFMKTAVVPVAPIEVLFLYINNTGFGLNGALVNPQGQQRQTTIFPFNFHLFYL